MSKFIISQPNFAIKLLMAISHMSANLSCKLVWHLKQGYIRKKSTKLRLPLAKYGQAMPLSDYYVKRSDVTGDPFEWKFGENNVI